MLSRQLGRTKEKDCREREDGFPAGIDRTDALRNQALRGISPARRPDRGRRTVKRPLWHLLQVKRENRRSTTAKTCSSSNCCRWRARLVTIAVDATLREAARLLCADLVHDVWLKMQARELKNVPIAGADGRPLGVLNARDALGVLLQDIRYEESLLRDYVMGVGYR